MAGLGDLFKEGSTAEQFLIWGVLQQLLQPLMFPFVTELGKLVNSAAPAVPISPGDAAQAVARGFIDAGSGRDKANDSGIGADDFAVLERMAGNAPALTMVFELLRRGLIGMGADDPADVSLRGALTDQGVRADWHDLVAKLAVQIPPAEAVMQALLEGQISADEAHRRYVEAGGDPTWFESDFNSRGEAPTPVQALDLLNRGIIGESGTGPAATSYEQAFLEGPWRNKWLSAFKALRWYLPPPRTVTAMYHDGQLTHAQAADYLAKQGLPAELVTAYLAPGATSKTATDKHLAKSDVTAAFADGIMTRAQATTALEAIGYSGHDAGVILDLVKVRTTVAQVSAGVTKTRALYTAGKISQGDARKVLVQLGMSDAQAGDVVATWALTQSHEVRTLTAAQVESGWYYGLLRTADAIAILMGMGYDEFDAWLSLSVRAHGPLRDYKRPASPYPPPPPKAGT